MMTTFFNTSDRCFLMSLLLTCFPLALSCKRLSLGDYYKVDEESEFLVVYDDISLDVGQLRIRKKGSAGGHNGMKNIISHLGTEVFPRIKVGVGEKPKKYDLADYVLSRFSKEERAIMEEGYQKAVEAVEMILRGEMDEAMNKFNRKVKPKEA